MPFMRRHARTSETLDLTVTLRSRGRHLAPRSVLDLSEGGMAIDGGEFKVGDLAGFELSGPAFRSAGLAEVAHRTGTRTGMRFIGWDSPTSADAREQIASRIRRHHSESAARTHPGTYLG